MKKQVFLNDAPVLSAVLAVVLAVFLAAVIVAALTIAGCSGPKTGQAELNISAASSLRGVMQELKGLYEQEQPGVILKFNYASSGALQQQIEQGAPADVFVSAGKKQMDALVKKGLVDKPQTVAGNSLVLVVPAAGQQGSYSQQNMPANLQELTAARFEKIAVGTPETVPAGKYAQEALGKAGIWAKILPKLVMAKDVQQVLVYVETGNVDAGFVYKSDAAASKQVKTAYVVPDNLHSRIIYPAAVVKASGQPERAAEFLKFLLAVKAQAVFKKYSFTADDSKQ